jgi:hypothetical protein
MQCNAEGAGGPLALINLRSFHGRFLPEFECKSLKAELQTSDRRSEFHKETDLSAEIGLRNLPGAGAGSVGI